MRNLRAVRGECGAVDHIGPRRTAHATRTPHWPTPLALSPLHAYAQALRICVWGHHVTTLYFSRVNTKVSASSSASSPRLPLRRAADENTLSRETARAPVFRIGFSVQRPAEPRRGGGKCRGVDRRARVRKRRLSRANRTRPLLSPICTIFHLETRSAPAVARVACAQRERFCVPAVVTRARARTRASDVSRVMSREEELLLRGAEGDGRNVDQLRGARAE